MSALDQALIKAYDKPTTRPPAAPPAAPVAGSGRIAPATAGVNIAAIERLYHDGGLYRVDVPTRATHGLARSERATLAGPHYDLLPPTSPKRGVRRSIMRLLANQQVPTINAAEIEPPAPPRVQRKVIIRHVAHGSPVAASNSIPPHHLPAVSAQEAEPPESPVESKDTIAAINELRELTAQVEVQSPWDIGAIDALSSIVVTDQTGFPSASAESLVNVQLDSLPESRTADIWTGIEHSDSADIEPTPGAFATKSLDDDRPATIRADQGHAPGPGRPHLSYTRTNASIQPQVAANSPVAAEPAVADELALADEDPPRVDDVVYAEAAPEPVKQDAAKSVAPVWEVDHFHWPRTCEKLLTDESGYLAQAGDKLLAAVGDGMKTLAITGSRRGEGRTTLALCLARVAARAGIQVALLDADFARPSLASRLGLEIAHGWQDAALGNIPLSEAAVKSLAENITVLPLEVSSARRGLSLADPRVTATLRAAAATFDLVIVDLGPLGPGERIAFPPGEACPLDATIVVRDLRFASATESHEVGERLYDAGVEAVGIAENFVIAEESLATA